MYLKIELVVFYVVFNKYSNAITRSDGICMVLAIAGIVFLVGSLSHFQIGFLKTKYAGL